MSDKTLHIFAQKAEHDDAWIVGTRDALRALRDEIDAVLGEKHLRRPVEPANGAETFFAADGEQFRCFIVCDGRKETWEQMRLPYGEIIVSPQGSLQHPSKLLSGMTIRDHIERLKKRGF